MSDWEVYIIHFDPPYKHARHYTGISLNSQDRFIEHDNGTGGNLTRIAKNHGVKFILNVIATGLSFYEAHAKEKLIKHKGSKIYCPICKQKGGENIA